MEAAWKGILTEADRLSDVHIKVKENLTVDVMQEIKTWQKDNFHKVSIHIPIYIVDFYNKFQSYIIIKIIRQ